MVEMDPPDLVQVVHLLQDGNKMMVANSMVRIEIDFFIIENLNCDFIIVKVKADYVYYYIIVRIYLRIPTSGFILGQAD